MKIVQHLHSEISHGEGLLRDSRFDHSFANPVQRVVVSIHGDHEFAGHMIVIQDSSHFFSALRFQADEAVDSFFLVEDSLRLIENGTWIAFHVHDPCDLDLWISSNTFWYPRSLAFRFAWLGIVKITTLPLP